MPTEKLNTRTHIIRPHPEVSLPPEFHLEPVAAARLWRRFWLMTLCLALCFAFPLWNLTAFAVGSELYSYILLIPFISFYLVWVKRQQSPPAFLPTPGLTAGVLTAGAITLVFYWLSLRYRFKLMEDDYLAVMMTAFLLFFFGVCTWFLGRQFLRANVFPLSFLIFLVPLPAMVVSGLVAVLQAGSAAVARGFFAMTGTPFFQDGLVFQLPGISIEIAPECSGIHSSLVLFITSLVASYLFLCTPWKRAIFILAVLPLSILRNGFRVYTIGELCVHIGPHMINSPIHHRGGPLFFALSLIPLFLLLVVLQRSERTGGGSKTKSRQNPNLESPE